MSNSTICVCCKPEGISQSSPGVLSASFLSLDRRGYPFLRRSWLLVFQLRNKGGIGILRPHAGSYKQYRQQPDPKRACCLVLWVHGPKDKPIGISWDACTLGYIPLGCLPLNPLFVGIRGGG